MILGIDGVFFYYKRLFSLISGGKNEFVDEFVYEFF